MSNALIPVITTRGLSAVFNGQNTGLTAEITHMALGDNGRKPSKNEVGLVNERMRIPIADGERIDDHQIHLTGVADGDTEFWVREIGFILKAVPLLLAFDLVLAALPANSVNIISTGAGLSLAAYADKFISNAAATISTQAKVIKNAHWNMQLSEKIRLMETSK